MCPDRQQGVRTRRTARWRSARSGCHAQDRPPAGCRLRAVSRWISRLGCATLAGHSPGRASGALRFSRGPMRPKPVFATFVLLAALAAGGAGAEGFKFSQPDEADRAESEARQNRIAEQLSTPCRADLKGKKIMVVI